MRAARTDTAIGAVGQRLRHPGLEAVEFFDARNESLTTEVAAGLTQALDKQARGCVGSELSLDVTQKLSSNLLALITFNTDFAETEVAPRAEAIDREERFPEELVQAVAARGYLAPWLPAASGGRVRASAGRD